MLAINTTSIAIDLSYTRANNNSFAQDRQKAKLLIYNEKKIKQQKIFH